MKFYLILLCALLVFGCSLPTTTVKTIDDRPSIIIKGAPDNSILYVDGLNMGNANQYDGESKALRLESGTHIVKVINAKEVIYEQRVFLEGAQRTITIR